jgi:hypothetical protein
MSQLTTISATKREVVHEAAPTPEKSMTSPASVLVTEQEVLFGTKAAAALQAEAPARRGWIGAIRAAVGSLHLPPPRQRYPRDPGYLEQARMAREMDRL